MKRFLPLTFLFGLTISFGSAQPLIAPRDNMEYMSRCIRVISDFDNNNTFQLGDADFIKDKTNHLNASYNVDLVGLNQSNGLKLTVEAIPENGGMFYLKTQEEIVLDSKTEGVGLWVKGNKDASLFFYFEDGNGKQFYVQKETIEGQFGWSFTFAVPHSIRRSNSGSSTLNPDFTYPCKFLGLGFVVRSKNSAIMIDDIMLVNEIDASVEADFSANPNKLANVYPVNEPIAIEARSAANKLKFVLKDYKGNILNEQKGGKFMSTFLPSDQPGYYELFVLSYEDDYEHTDLVSGEVFQFAVIDTVTTYNDLLAVATHPQRGYYAKESVELMSIVGAGYMRMGLVLEFMENDDGTFSLSEKTLDLLNNARTKGLKFICIFRDKTPPLEPDQVEHFLNYCRFLLDEYRSVIDKVELWNEWSHSTGTHEAYKSLQTAENYTKFVRSVYPVLKEEYPEVEFIGLGGENPQRYKAEIIEMLEAGAANYMDAISLHPYRQPHSPDSREPIVHHKTMAEQVTDIVAISQKHKGPEKVYITEIGYPSVQLEVGLSSFTQAQHLVKVLSMLLATNVVENVTWYNLYTMYELIAPESFQERPHDWPQHGFGLFEGKEHNFSVNHAAIAFRHFARISDGFEEGSMMDKDGLFKVILKGSNQGELEIVWDNKENESYAIKPQYSVFDLMGNPIDHAGEVKLTREPIYIVKSPLKQDTTNLNNKVRERG